MTGDGNANGGGWLGGEQTVRTGRGSCVNWE